jgi:UDPglucose 6-dehydrogenase
MNIVVVGTGYVGLTTGVCLAEIGHNILCIDKDEKKIEKLNQGIIPIYEPGLEDISKKLISAKRLKFSTSICEGIDFADVIFVAVGTPPKSTGEADLSSVERVAIDIAKNMKSYKLIVSKSTVPVETGKKIFNTIKIYNQNIEFDVVSNPEFLREGSAIQDFLNPDRIVIGVSTEKAKNIMLEVYKNIDAPKIVTDIESAELIKHASNSFLALKISYANALSQICEKVGADVRLVTKGMGYDKRIGNSFLNAGVGFGGSCFPKDLSAFIEISKEAGYDFRLLEEVKKINDEQKKHFVKKIKDVLWNLNDKKIAILGLAFKPNTDDMREAPAIDVINDLLAENAKVRVYDPVAMENAKNILGDSVVYCDNIYDVAEGANAVLILTEWEEFKNIDFEKLKEKLITPIIIDGRNIFDEIFLKNKGFIYKGIGC